MFCNFIRKKAMSYLCSGDMYHIFKNIYFDLFVTCFCFFINDKEKSSKMSFKGTDIAAGNSRFENRIKFQGFCHFAPPFILPDLTHYFAIGALLSLLLTLNIFHTLF